MTSASRAAPPNDARPRPAPRTIRCPTTCVGPTPRSQIRMRTRSGASTCANSTLVPLGKHRVMLERGARARRTARRRAAGRAATHCGLPMFEHDQLAAIRPPAIERHLPDIGRQTHRGAKRLARRRRGRSASAACRRPRCRIVTAASSRSSSRSSSAARPRTPLPDTSARLPSAFSSRIDAPSGGRRRRGSGRPRRCRCADRTLARQRRRAATCRDVAICGRRGSRCRRRGLWRSASSGILGCYFRAERQQVPAEAADQRARQRVERADEQAVVDRPLPAAVQPRLHREPLGHDPHVAETPTAGAGTRRC